MKRTQQWIGFSSITIQRILLGLMLMMATEIKVVAEPSVRVIAQTEQTEDWRSRFTQLFRRKPPIRETPGTSRGGFCLLSPGGLFDQGAAALWEQRPTLIWTGAIAKVAVREIGANELLWSQSIPMNPNPESKALQTLRYSGPLLQAGKRYEWQVFERESASEPQQFRAFSILNSQSRGPATRAWMQEQIALMQVGATNAEQAQRQRAFLLEQELSADFYQALFLAATRGQLDGEESAIVDGIVGEWCGDSVQ